MNAILGRTAAMYVRFCSGPTPMYTPPATRCSRSMVNNTPISPSFDV